MTVALAAGIVYAACLPLEFDFSRSRLGQVEQLLKGFSPDGGQMIVQDAADAHANVVLFALFGAVMMLALRGRYAPRGPDDPAAPWRAFAALVVTALAGLALSLLSEGLQVFVPGRVPSALDLACNGSGTMVGAGLVWLAEAHAQPLFSAHVLRPDARAVRRFGLRLAVLIVLAIYCWPFDVVLEAGEAVRRVKVVIWQVRWPVDPYSPAFSAMAFDATVFAALGFIWGRHRRLSRPTGAFFGELLWVLVGCVGVSLAIESTQLLLYSHTPDVNDVLWGAAGSAMGAVAGLAYRPAERARRRTTTPQTGLPRPALARWPGVIACTAWLATLTLDRLWPFRFQQGLCWPDALGRMSLVPLQAINGNSSLHSLELAVGQLTAFVPVGAFLYALLMGWDTRWNLKATALGVAFSMTWAGVLEVLQLSIPGRTADLTTVFLAGLGSAAGSWLYYRLACWRRRWAEAMEGTS